MIEDPYLTGSADPVRSRKAKVAVHQVDLPHACQPLNTIARQRGVSADPKQGRCNGILSMVPIGNDGRMDARVALAGAPALATSC